MAASLHDTLDGGSGNDLLKGDSGLDVLQAAPETIRSTAEPSRIR